MTTERYALAPMSGLILGLTVLTLSLPLVFFALGTMRGLDLVSAAMNGAGLFVVLICVVVWLFFRPTRFELTPQTLEIVWPLRRQRILYSEIESAEPTTSRGFKDQFGWAVRFGVGGLWGGFGHLWTSKGTVRFYISRTDGYVLMRVRGDKPLLITPERPEEFLRTLESRLGRT